MFVQHAKQVALWILAGIVVVELTLSPVVPRFMLGTRIPIRGDWLYWTWVVIWPTAAIPLAVAIFVWTYLLTYKLWIGFVDAIHVMNVMLYRSWTELLWKINPF